MYARTAMPDPTPATQEDVIIPPVMFDRAVFEGPTHTDTGLSLGTSGDDAVDITKKPFPVAVHALD